MVFWVGRLTGDPESFLFVGGFWPNSTRFVTASVPLACVYIYIHVYVEPSKATNIQINILAYIYIYIYMYTYTHVYTYMYICFFTFKISRCPDVRMSYWDRQVFGAFVRALGGV